MSTVIDKPKKKYAIPQVIHADRPEMEDFDDIHKAACKHMKGLSKAESELEEARDLCETLRGYLKESEDYTTETVVNLIEERIWKARHRLDRHDSKHLNLFFAYFDLKGGAA